MAHRPVDEQTEEDGSHLVEDRRPNQAVDDVEDVLVGGCSALTGLEQFDCRNNRLALLGLQQDGFIQTAIQALERYGAHRVAVILGSSTSGILETGHADRHRDPATGALPSSYLASHRYSHNMFSAAHFVRTYLGLRGPAMVISTACSSSAKAFATAARLKRLRTWSDSWPPRRPTVTPAK